MSELVTDPTDSRLGNGVDSEPSAQNAVYLVLSDDERAKGFVRPFRRSYIHPRCGVVTRMSVPIAETYARDPHFYGSTYCVGCSAHLVVDEFLWDGTTERVGS